MAAMERRRGSLRGTDAQERSSRARNADLEARIASKEESALDQARAERASGGRYQDSPRPRRANAGDLGAGDAAAGNPQGVSFLEHMLGPRRDGTVRGEDVRPGGDFSIGRTRNLAYGRADQAAMQDDVDREVKRRMSDERAYKKGGAVKKMVSGGAARGDGKAVRGKTKGKFV